MMLQCHASSLCLGVCVSSQYESKFSEFVLHSHSSKHSSVCAHTHAHVSIHTHLELQSGESRASKSSRSDITWQYLCKRRRDSRRLNLLSVLLIFKNGQSTVEQTIDTDICEVVMQDFGFGLTGNVSNTNAQHLKPISDIILYLNQVRHSKQKIFSV